jgi:hypothetical protein
MDAMECRKAQDRMSDYRDGTLDPLEAVEVAAHLMRCGECASVAESLDAVRLRLRGLSPAPAPPELLPRVLAAVEAESGSAGAASGPAGTGARKSFLARFRVPVEAAAAVLLIASVYWYQRTVPPVSGPPPVPAAQAPKTVPRSDVSPDASPDVSPNVSKYVSPKASPDAAKVASSEAPVARARPKAAREKALAAAKPREWTAADLPSVPAIRASSGSERIVPVAPLAEPEAKREEAAGAAAGGPAFPEGRGAEAVRPPDALMTRVFAPPPSRLHRPLPYGREVWLNVEPGNRAGAEDRIAAAAIRRGGLIEQIVREGGPGTDGAPGMVRVVLPGAAAAGFLEELGRIGTVPHGGAPAAAGVPEGPRPGTVAYAVRIGVR